MNSNSTAYCLIKTVNDAQEFIFNDNIRFSDEDLFYLKRTLTENMIENLCLAHESEVIQINIFPIEQFDSETFERYNSDKVNIKCFTDKEKFLESLKQFSKFIFILADTMGISPTDIKKAEDLISSDDNSLVISKSENNDICYTAFNKYDNNLISILLDTKTNYDYLLTKIKTEKFFIHIIGGHFRVNSFSNFKLLYNKLSHKDSFSYCSQYIHEKLTNLFIEYRDYIK